MNILNKDVFESEEVRTLKVGDQIRMNHFDCPAGADLRERLYVKRIGADALIGYCHNCGSKGFKFASGILSRAEDLKSEKAPAYVGEGIIKFNSGGATTVMPLQARAYLKKYDLDQSDADKWKLYFKPGSDKLIMPFGQYGVYNEGSYQARYLSDTFKQRYLTRKVKGSLPYSIFQKDPTSNLLYIVEDQISAYRICRDTGYTAVALLGTNISEEAVASLPLTTQTYVWLDNDAAGKLASIVVTRAIQNRMSALNVTGKREQPKNYSRYDLIAQIGKNK